jgi:hypothetical protein
MTDPLFQYAVRYRRDDAPLGRIFRLTVLARSADEARAKAKINDPHFRSTVVSPHRRGMVVDL